MTEVLVLVLSSLWLVGVGLAPVGAPPSHHIAGVPLVERNTNWCGPAALAAVLRFHGEEVGAEEIAKEIYLPGYRGSLNLDLLIYARQRKFEVWAKEGTAEALRGAVARDRPVICMVRRGNPLASRNHFVVVTGYDETRGEWTLDSGEGKEETMRASDFEGEWGKCGSWMLVVEGREKRGEVGESKK
jgi:ABC-type bacteriocin/lantibiotic exporter with double-glycine peptidase domain